MAIGILGSETDFNLQFATITQQSLAYYRQVTLYTLNLISECRSMLSLGLPGWGILTIQQFLQLDNLGTSERLWTYLQLNCYLIIKSFCLPEKKINEQQGDGHSINKEYKKHLELYHFIHFLETYYFYISFFFFSCTICKNSNTPPSLFLSLLQNESLKMMLESED